jgi:hypothetical protein
MGIIRFFFSFYFRSGLANRPNDIIPMDSLVEIKPTDLFLNELKKSNRERTNDNFFPVSVFDKNGLANNKIEPEFGRVEEIRIRIRKESENWIILHEIAFFS